MARTSRSMAPAARRSAASRRRRPALIAMTATPPVQDTRKGNPNTEVKPVTVISEEADAGPKAMATSPIVTTKGRTVAAERRDSRAQVRPATCQATPGSGMRAASKRSRTGLIQPHRMQTNINPHRTPPKRLVKTS